MKILGIGNAIVDVICKVDDSFILQNNLTKSTMKLFFDKNEFKNLLTDLKIEKTGSLGPYHLKEFCIRLLYLINLLLK